MSKKARCRYRYPAELWEEIKVGYLTGEKGLEAYFASAEDALTARFGKVPSVTSVVKRATIDKWREQKAKMGDVLAKSTRQRMIDYAADIGFRVDKEVLDVAREMLTALKTEIIRDAKAQDGDAKGFAETKPDYYARDKAITHLSKMFELYGAEKVAHSGNPVTEIVVNFQTAKAENVNAVSTGTNL
jgi:hypothetical protein